jgi:cephalosporin-C deacetylase-like acetyl esterase
MRSASRIFASVLAICASTAAQTPPAADASKVFAYDAKKPLNLTIGKSEAPTAGATVFEIFYDSPKGGRVSGYLVVPSGKGLFAAIVYMHWGQGNRGEFLSEAVEMAQRGAIGIMIDAPYWRPDVPPPAEGNKAESERDGYIQMVMDLRRAVDVLVARKDVDPDRIGYIGHSLGATWGAPLAAVEKRIKVFVLMGGLPKVPPDWDDDSFYQQVQRAMTPRAEFDKEAAVLGPIEPERFAANTGPAKIYFQWAQHDMYISQKSADEYFNAVGGPKEQKWYFTSHEFNDAESKSDRASWLMHALGLKANAH